MEKQAWLNTLRAELARQKLPSGYVARLLSELTDHYHDFMEDHMSMDARDLRGVFDRLGPPETLARHAAASYQPPFGRRHPLVTFALLPLVMLPVLWAGLIAAFVVVAQLVKSGASAPPAWFASSLPTVGFLIMMIPVLIATAIVCRVASRAHVDWKWQLLGCVVVSLLAGMAMFNVTVGPDNRGSMSFGLGLGAEIRWMQLAQFVVPLALGGWLIWRRMNDTQQHVLS